MKNLKFQLLGLLFLLFVANSYSQNSEIKINGFYLFINYGEVTYEHILDDESAIGISAGIGFNDDTYYEYSVMPYYRFYFGKKRAVGFFIEGSGAIYKPTSNLFTSRDPDTQVGLGLAPGFKLKTDNDIVFEIFAGVGRSSFENIANSYYPRLGLSIGKRF